MINGPGFTRDLKSGEEDAVDALLRAAFPTADEAELVRKLRKSGVMAGESVMPLGDALIGYFALSYLVKPKGWLALAPVAVAPEHQRHGYGKRMMGMLSEWSRISGTPVVVVGNPDFYRKSGFSREAAAGLTSPYPLEFTMLSGAAGVPKGVLQYPKAFDGV